MHYSLVDTLPWAVALLVHLTLLFVLIGRGRWQQFPILTAWIAFLATRTVVLFFAYIHASKYWYTRIYDGGLWIDFALQFGLALEIARIVLRPTGTWVRDARFRFAAGGIAGTAAAALLAWWVTPPASSTRLFWTIRGNLFTSLVICELFVLASLTANRLGLGWRNHVMAVGEGLTIWSSVTVVTTALQSFLGTQRLYLPLGRVSSITYIAAIAWITVQLWRQEPERQPLSPDLQEYILALHKRVEYDLRRLDAGH
jgi:hypothetical protein